MVLLILKVLHLLSVIVWIGVLLYMPRLLILQTEASAKTEPERSILITQYKKMSRSMWIKVGWPAAILTLIFGLGIMHPYFSSMWFWVKMVLVVVLFIYHHMIHFANKNLQRDKYTKSVKQLRNMNNAGIVFIIAIVALGVLKSSIDIVLMIGGLVVIAFLVFMGSKALLRNSSKSQ
ncbi:MAG: hypothetical protein HC819_22205 [Cyclobacteriaceae bacterium]|nr:hypothetical protein [Cyclobacteriaceae bacterium]